MKHPRDCKGMINKIKILHNNLQLNGLEWIQPKDKLIKDFAINQYKSIQPLDRNIKKGRQDKFNNQAQLK